VGIGVFDLNGLIEHWRYVAIFVVVVLGNLGLPVPEEAVLILAGFLVWGGKLRLPPVLVVSIMGAVVGDNLGYWAGRHYGQTAIKRYGHHLFITEERFESMQRFVERYGPLGVFIARFLPGLRFLAGPLAGTAGLRFLSFLVSNVLGAAVYVPIMVGVGYAIGHGLGGYVEEFQRVVGEIEYPALIVLIILSVGLLGWRAVRARASA
jgi:membrane protein DedA with SNARE-associated domain